MKRSRIILYSWLLARTYHKNLMIWNFFSWESGKFWETLHPQTKTSAGNQGFKMDNQAFEMNNVRGLWSLSIRLP